MDYSNISEKLCLFGLTRQEAQLYICLYQNGELTGYEVSKQTGISRSNVYTGLAELVEEGAAYIVGGSANKYRAVSIDEFCSNHIRKLEEARKYLLENIPKPIITQEGYITIQGNKHIKNKLVNMLRSAEKRIYISTTQQNLELIKDEILALCDRHIKVVIIAKQLPSSLKEKVRNDIIYYHKLENDELNEMQKPQIRLIIDSQYVMTGDMSEQESDSCLYSDQKNFVAVFKEAMHNEIALIQLRREDNDKKTICNERIN